MLIKLKYLLYLQEFLSKLERPLSVPDDKITRWHPRFSLDEVPDVEEADLPQPPNVKSFTSAKDVLHHAQSNLPSRVSGTIC